MRKIILVFVALVLAGCAAQPRYMRDIPLDNVVLRTGDWRSIAEYCGPKLVKERTHHGFMRYEYRKGCVKQEKGRIIMAFPSGDVEVREHELDHVMCLKLTGDGYCGRKEW